LSGSSDTKPVNVASIIPIKPWVWLAVTCSILSVSGGIRFWRDLQFSTLARESANCPFALSDLPTTLGTWHAEEGEDSKLDPEISGIAGSSADLVRLYKDSKTGETATVLVLYGAAQSVFGHTPDICYPSSGFQHVIKPLDRALPTSTAPKSVAFRTSYFTKKEAGLSQYVEVFCTFRQNGQWVPDAASRWKTFRSHPGMFKIQIQRPTSGLTTEESPMESLLKATAEAVDSRLEAIEHRLNENEQLAGANAKPNRD